MSSSRGGRSCSVTHRLAEPESAKWPQLTMAGVLRLNAVTTILSCLQLEVFGLPIFACF